MLETIWQRGHTGSILYKWKEIGNEWANKHVKKKFRESDECYGDREWLAVVRGDTDHFWSRKLPLRRPHLSLELSDEKEQEIRRQGLPWWSSGWDSALPLQGAQVRSLVGEIKSHMLSLPGQNKKPIKKERKKERRRTSLVVQRLRIHLPVQGTRVWSLARKIPRATEQLSPCATTTEPVHLEPMLCNKRSHCNEKPAHRKEE